MAERRVDFVVRAAGDHGVQAAHLGGREDDVGRDADHQRPGRDAAERLLQSAPPAARVVRVEGVEDRVIGTSNKSISLMISPSSIVISRSV